MAQYVGKFNWNLIIAVPGEKAAALSSEIWAQIEMATVFSVVGLDRTEDNEPHVEY